jgi:hypothetical protein
VTERLATLLREQADAIDVPRPAPAEILARGRSLRTRRRWARTGAAVTVAAALAVGGLAVRDHRGHGVDPARAADAFASLGAFAIGHELYLGDERVHFDASIKAVFYTSAGVMVRTGGTSDPDDGPSTFTLVSPTGERSAVGVQLGNRVAGFEPDSTRFAYAVAAGGRDQWEVVVHDAVTDQELARVPVAGPAYGGWDAPPVAIDGDLAWIHLANGWTEVDWRTGATRPVPDTADTYEVQNGRYAVQRGHDWEIRAMADGSAVGQVDLQKGWYAFFSPDGRAMRAFPNDVRDEPAIRSVAYDVASGESHEHPRFGNVLGWTPDGHLLWSHGDTVSVCELLTDECDDRWTGLPTGTVRLGGEAYNS